jgi:dTDP-4-amino-4,6-dideoxygalactose transaminase
VPSIDDLPHRAATSSGRAAICHALNLLALPPDSTVLVPTYHCPSMVEAIVHVGLQPRFFAIDAQGMPNLTSIGPGARAMLVAHYFGIPRSLTRVREFCTAHGIALVEDCAHTFFGIAGERQVGAWGDFAIASLSKFFPGPGSGLLASATRPINLRLARPGFVGQLKGFADTLEAAYEFKRIRGLHTVLGAALALKRLRSNPPVRQEGSTGRETCHMTRVGRAPTATAVWLQRTLPRARVVARRRENFDRYAQALRGTRGARPLFSASDSAAAIAPYVFPLWVDDSDRVYHALRSRGAAVLRWDQLWDDTPDLAGDHGKAWGRHVLQLLCHQDLSVDDISATTASIQELLELRVEA